jgi:amino acid transporter
LLEFVALVVLRVREPDLERPFKAGNFASACLLGVGPAVLIGYALWVSRDDKLMQSNSPIGSWLGSIPALLFASVVGLMGPLFYWATAGQFARRKALFQVTERKTGEA